MGNILCRNKLVHGDAFYKSFSDFITTNPFGRGLIANNPFHAVTFNQPGYNSIDNEYTRIVLDKQLGYLAADTGSPGRNDRPGPINRKFHDPYPMGLMLISAFCNLLFIAFIGCCLSALGVFRVATNDAENSGITLTLKLNKKY